MYVACTNRLLHVAAQSSLLSARLCCCVVVAICISLVEQQDREPPAALGGCFQYSVPSVLARCVCKYEPSITAGQ